MPEKTLIIHGWSDHSDSFIGMKAFIERELGQPTEEIFFADYESRDDRLSLETVADDLQQAMKGKGLLKEDGTAPEGYHLNIVVHSTGGLVVRQWLWKNYYDAGRMGQCPVARVVMMAPANFGSPLAEMGKSFLGRLLRGQWNSREPLEVGQLFLDDLEIASKFQWDLSHRDLLIPDPYFAYDKIKTTILVGANPSPGLRYLISRPGTDGTVVIAGTSLDSAKIILDVTNPGQPRKWLSQTPLGEFAFGVLEGYDHGGIVQMEGSPGTAGKYLKKALLVKTADEMRQLDAELEETTRKFYQPSLWALAVSLFSRNLHRPYQQFFIHAVDEDRNPIPRFWLEFFLLRRARAKNQIIENDPLSRDGQGSLQDLDPDEKELTARLNQVMAEQVHTFSRDSSYRSFLVDLAGFDEVKKKAGQKFGQDYVLSARVYVPPDNGAISYDIQNLQNVVLHDPQVPDKLSFIHPNTTTLVEIRIRKTTLKPTPGSLSEVTVSNEPFSKQKPEKGA